MSPLQIQQENIKVREFSVFIAAVCPCPAVQFWFMCSPFVKYLQNYSYFLRTFSQVYKSRQSIFTRCILLNVFSWLLMHIFPLKFPRVQKKYCYPFKIADSRKKQLKIHHLFFHTKQFAPIVAISFRSNVKTPTIMLSSPRL